MDIEEKGLKYLLDGEFKKASRLYLKNNLEYEYGLSELLKGNLKTARAVWFSLDDDKSPIICWGKTLLGIIEETYDYTPGYLEVKNYFECDINLLIIAKQYKFIDTIINNISFLANANCEAYKYLGRVLFAHRYYQLSYKFLMEGLEVCPDDPEADFLLALLHLTVEEIDNAKLHLERVLKVEPEYYPALKYLNKIKNN